MIERAVILCDGETFSVDETWLKRESPPASGPVVPLVTTLVERERANDRSGARAMPGPSLRRERGSQQSWEFRARRLTQESPASASTNIDLRPGRPTRKQLAHFSLRTIANCSSTAGIVALGNHAILAENSAIAENTATYSFATASYSNTFERRALCTNEEA